MGPYFLIYDTVGLYPLIYLQRKYHPRHLLYIDCPASVPPLLIQWAYHSSFMTQWAYTPSFTYRVSTNLVIYCTQTVQLHFLPYLHSGSIPPHFLTQWAYTPHFLTQWANKGYGPTVQVREEMRLDSLCTADGEGGAHCVRK